MTTLSKENLLLDSTKLPWHRQRVEAWKRGERVAPVTIDMGLTQACQYRCQYCYAQFQRYNGHALPEKILMDLLDDCAEIGVLGISLLADGESTLSPSFVPFVQRAKSLGISVGVGTNGRRFDRRMAEAVLPCLEWIRFTVSAGSARRYAEIMGASVDDYYHVCHNIRTAVAIKNRDDLPVTIGMHNVLIPDNADQIFPFAMLAVDLEIDYAIVKHTTDDPQRGLKIDYRAYEPLYPVLRGAEALSNAKTSIQVKWSKITSGASRSYCQCYGPPFMLQISGLGRVAPCGTFFSDKYDRYHLGDLTQERFKDIWKSERYWEVMNHLASPNFDMQQHCSTLCVQHHLNEMLDRCIKEDTLPSQPDGPTPLHVNFL